jgi:polysaccharide deacetylase 2 family uncharacterized protein YibQ
LHPLALCWIALFAGLSLLVLFVMLFGKAGGPVARLDISPLPHAPAQPSAKQAQAAAPAESTVPAGQPEAGTPESQAQAPGKGAPDMAPPATKGPEPKLPPQLVPAEIVKPVYAEKALIADPALIQQTPQGPLPHIAEDGRTPMRAYAPPISPAALKGRKKIAIVITGLGISARATAAALDGLPPGVTLAFAPYAADVQRWVSKARKLGHEVLLEVPMEPYDFPDSDPGQHTLRPMLGEEKNIKRLDWSLTRFTGYTGVTNLLGGRFLANSDAAAPVMTYLARRGLLFYDSGTTSRSAAGGIAAEIGAPYVQSDVSIDSIQSGMEIDQRLSELEARARAKGTAAGTGFLYPVTIDRVAAWADGLKDRGFVLVPASAIVAGSK